MLYLFLLRHGAPNSFRAADNTSMRYPGYRMPDALMQNVRAGRRRSYMPLGAQMRAG